MPALSSVARLMCTYNGESFLTEQLESFKQQTHTRWKLVVSDDGSADSTLKILQDFHRRWGSECIRIIPGPKQGYVKNFLSLTRRSDIEADIYAWSDQDDIWGNDKLKTAIAWLDTIAPGIPALYCGRTQLISERGAPIGYSPCFSRSPHFTNALVQNIGGGNTMVFNQAARRLIQETHSSLIIPSHDWWAYLLISGAGGTVYYDSAPQLLYRQHGDNLVGSNSSWRARLHRIRMLFRGRFYEWNTQNILALESMREHLSSENQNTLTFFMRFRTQALPFRLINLFRSHLYRQTLLGNLGLIAAAALKKL